MASAIICNPLLSGVDILLLEPLPFGIFVTQEPSEKQHMRAIFHGYDVLLFCGTTIRSILQVHRSEKSHALVEAPPLGAPLGWWWAYVGARALVWLWRFGLIPGGAPWLGPVYSVASCRQEIASLLKGGLFWRGDAFGSGVLCQRNRSQCWDANNHNAGGLVLPSPFCFNRHQCKGTGTVP